MSFSFFSPPISSREIYSSSIAVPNDLLDMSVHRLTRFFDVINHWRYFSASDESLHRDLTRALGKVTLHFDREDKALVVLVTVSRSFFRFYDCLILRSRRTRMPSSAPACSATLT